MTVVKKFTESEYREFLKQFDDVNIEEIIARVKAKKKKLGGFYERKK